jgi:tetratricopeptide (TPR) repeat protein
MDGDEKFAFSKFSFASGDGMTPEGTGGSKSASAACEQALLDAPQPMPRTLRAAQGYLELATGAAARFGLAPRLRRRTLRTVLHLAATYQAAGPHRAMRHLLIGQALRLLGRHRAAAAMLKKASTDRRLRRDALLALAWCQKRLGHLDEAVTAVTRALAAAPDDAALHYNLACYLALSTQPRAALYELAWALELKPRLRSRASAETDFDSLRGSAAFEALTAPNRRVSQRPTSS